MNIILTKSLTILGSVWKPIKRAIAWHLILNIYRLARLTSSPTLLMEEAWENLIILDACRFDAFSVVNWIPGTLKKVISAGSTTWEWFVNNFKDRKLDDVIYISANPFISSYHVRKWLGSIPFYKIIEVWRFGWNQKLKTVHPSTVNKATMIALKHYPGKKFIIHYLQPHYPFIGRLKLIGDEYVFNMLRSGKISVDFAWKAYLSNLEYVLIFVEKMLKYLRGNICITSDHGNAFGRFGVFYGHTANVPLPELIEVPWLKIRND